MKKLLTILLCLLCSSALAQEHQTNISTIILNKDAFLDTEVIIDDKNFYLPFKALCKIFEIKYTQNHVTKDISFNSCGKINYKGKYVLINGINVPTEVILIKNGIMEETQDELFLPTNTLSKIFESNIAINTDDLSIEIQTEKSLSILETENNSKERKNLYKAYTQVFVPAKKNTITLDTIELSNDTRSDSFKEALIENKNRDFTINNNTRLALNGQALGGNYTVDFNTYNHTGQAFSFGGLGVNYQNTYKNHDWQAGKLSGINFQDASIGSNTYGLMISKTKNSIKDYKEIQGKVKSGNLVNVLADGKYVKTLNTYNGFYSLNNLNLKNQPKTIEIQELLPDKTQNKVKEESINKFSVGEEDYSLISGISGLNNMLWSENGYIYESNAKKFLLSGKITKQMTEKLYSETLISSDKVVSAPSSSWGESYLNNPEFLNFNIFRNTNNLQGQTLIRSYNYQLTENTLLKSSIGLSRANDYSQNTFSKAGLGLSAEAKYSKPNYNFHAKLFDYDSNYYVAGSSGSFLFDRRGGEIGGRFNYKKFNLNTKVSHYASNLDNYMPNGKLLFNEYNISSSTPLSKKSAVRFRYNGRFGENNIGKLKNNSYDISYNNRLTSDLRINAGKQGSFYKTKYSNSDSSSAESNYNMLYSKLTYNLPKDWGKLELGHDVVGTKTFSSENNYKVARIGYTFPQIHNVICNFSTGYRYTGENKGFDFSATLGYEFNSGRRIDVNYLYNRNIGYVFDGIFLPSSTRHSININLNDVFAVINDSLKSIGENSPDDGYVQICAFLDVNKNGIKDKNEPGIKDIPIKPCWLNEPVCTNKQGDCPVQNIEEGFYSIELYEKNLPVLLSLSPQSEKTCFIKVDKKNKTCVCFGLVSSVGNISGNVDIKDEFGRDVALKDLVVVLIDKDGNEVAYTTIDQDYNFVLTGISPGEYTVKVDENYMELYNIIGKENYASQKITIPPVYDDYVDITDLKLKYVKNYNLS